MIRILTILLSVLALALPGQAAAAGGSYVFDGATATERETVRRALNASHGVLSLGQARHVVRRGRAREDAGEDGSTYVRPAATRSTGDARVRVAPGEVSSRLVELLLAALRRDDRASCWSRSPV